MRASRPLLAATATAMLMLASVAGPAFADRPIAGCPPGFIDDAFTLEEALAYKVGLPTGSVEYFTGYFASTDKNGDGLVCMKDLPDTPGIPPYVTQLMDNVASS
jgi:hypothetical protein